MPTGPKPPIPNGVAKIIHEGTIFLKNWANIFYFLMTTSGPVGTTDVNSLALKAHQAYETNLQPWKSDQSSILQTKAIYVPTTGTEILGEYAHTTAGGTTSQAAPSSTAAVVSWINDLYYRGGHPRTYFDGGYMAHITTGNTWDSAFISALENDAYNYLSAVNLISTTNFASCELGTVSYARHNAWRPTAVFTPYFGVTMHPRVDSQRRRLGKEVV